MIYRIVLIFSLAGAPQEFVGTTAFDTLPACNMRLAQFAELRLPVDWIATCRGDVRA